MQRLKKTLAIATDAAEPPQGDLDVSVSPPLSPGSPSSGSGKKAGSPGFGILRTAIRTMTMKSPANRKSPTLTEVYYHGSAVQAPIDNCKKDLHMPLRIEFEKTKLKRKKEDAENSSFENARNGQNVFAWADLSCGPTHCCLVTEQGDLFTWGLHNGSGQLGLAVDPSEGIMDRGDDEEDNPIGAPRHIDRIKDDRSTLRDRWQLSSGVGFSGLVSRSSQKAYTWGGLSGNWKELQDDYVNDVPQPLPFDKKVEVVAFGGSHMLVATSMPDGFLFAAGNNRLGQLGLGSAKRLYMDRLTQIKPITNCVAIGCGRSHSMCIAIGPKGAKQLFAWGDTTAGKLGLGAIDHDLGNMDKLDNEADMEEGKAIDDNPRVLSPMPIDWFIKENLWLKRFVCGNDYNLAICSNRPEDADGWLYAWGSGANYRTGLNSPFNQDLPCAVGNALGWGPHGSVRIEKIAAGYTHSAAIDSDGNLYTFGTCAKGGLGLGPITSVAQVPTQVQFNHAKSDQQKVLHVGCGENFTVSIVKVELKDDQAGSKPLGKSEDPEEDERFQKYKSDVIHKLLQMRPLGDKMGSIERYIGISNDTVRLYSSGLWPVLNRKEFVYEMKTAEHHECRPDRLNLLFPELKKPPKTGENQAAEQDKTKEAAAPKDDHGATAVDAAARTKHRPKSAPAERHQGGYSFPQAEVRLNEEAKRTQAAAGAAGQVGELPPQRAFEIHSPVIGFAGTIGRKEREVRTSEQVPGPGAYGSTDRGPSLKAVQLNAPSVEFSQAQGRFLQNRAGEGSRGPGAYDVDKAKRMSVVRIPEWSFESAKPRQTEREAETLDAQRDFVPFLRHMPQHTLVEPRSPSADFMKSSVQRFATPAQAHIHDRPDKGSGGGDVYSSLGEGGSYISTVARFDYANFGRVHKRRTPREELELNREGQRKVQEFLAKRSGGHKAAAQRSELHRRTVQRRTSIERQREDRLVQEQERRQRRLEAKNAEIFVQQQAEVTRIWCKWFCAVSICEQMIARRERRRQQWRFVLGICFLMRRCRRWKVYFVCSRLRVNTRIRISLRLTRYSKFLRERMNKESSGLVLQFLQKALDLGQFTKQVKTFLYKVVQLQAWIRQVLDRMNLGFVCIRNKWKRKLLNRRSETLNRKDIIPSRTDRSRLDGYLGVLERYEYLFGNKLWPLLRKVRKKDWHDIKTQYLGMGQFHEMREAQMWLLGSEHPEDNTELFQVGAYVSTYNGLLTNASFEKWEKIVYISFMGHLKKESTTGSFGMTDEALEQLAVKTIKANGGTEHFANPSEVHNNTDFDNAMKLLGGPSYSPMK